MSTYAEILECVVENGRLERSVNGAFSAEELEAEIEFEARERGLDESEVAEAVAWALAHSETYSEMDGGNLFDYLEKYSEDYFVYLGTVWGSPDEPWIASGKEIAEALRSMWAEADENGAGYDISPDSVSIHGHLLDEAIIKRLDSLTEADLKNVSDEMVHACAKARVDKDAELQGYFNERENERESDTWIVTAPRAELLDWAQRIRHTRR